MTAEEMLSRVAAAYPDDALVRHLVAIARTAHDYVVGSELGWVEESRRYRALCETVEALDAFAKERPAP